MNSSGSYIKRALALFIAFTLSVEEAPLVHASIAAPIYDQAALPAQQLSDIAGNEIEKDFVTFALPSHLGTVEALKAQGSENYVFHIRDLHINENAQLRIAEIVDHLSATFGITLIETEGSAGLLTHKPLSRHPSDKARALSARAFLRSGMMNGAEYLAVTKRPDLLLFGVEGQGAL